MKTLILLWSGGLDSTAALWRLATSRNEWAFIHAFHVTLFNAEARAEAERRAVAEQLHWLSRQQLRAGLGFAECVVDLSRVPYIPDVEVMFFFGAQYARSVNATAIMMGRCVEDNAPWGAYPSGRLVHDISAPPGNYNDTEKFQNARSLVRTITGRDCIVHSPYIDKTKAEIAADMPNELLNLVWGCRQPYLTHEGYIPCGACHACVDFMRNGLSHRPVVRNVAANV